MSKDLEGLDIASEEDDGDDMMVGDDSSFERENEVSPKRKGRNYNGGGGSPESKKIC